MNRDRLKKYTNPYTRNDILDIFDNEEKIKDFLKRVNEANDTLKNWQEKVINLLPDSKKNLKKSIGKSDLEDLQLCLHNYLKLCSIYKLAECLSVKINEFVSDNEPCYNNMEDIYGELKEFERIVFHFIDIFNGRIEDFLDSNDKKAFDWMCQNINGLEGRITSSEIESIKNLLGKIKDDIEVIPGYSYSKIVDFIRNGMKDDAVYDKAIKCRDSKNISIK